MEEQVELLSRDLVHKLANLPSNARLLVGISGIPASGKSTFADRVVRRCNELLLEVGGHSKAILVGLDGWHLTRAQLDAFPDSKLAHDRRGAHWTFDGSGYTSFVTALKAPLLSPTPGATIVDNDSGGEPEAVTSIFAPSFDHAVKDPSPDSVQIDPHHRIVLIEGLYTFLAIDPWKQAGEMLDERWFIEVDFEEAAKRLVKRHVVTGVARDMEEAVWRSETNDMPNGRFIIENNLKPTRTISSIPDERLPKKT
ncbi:P-loop containing nucleoside triphosphate hydrolase protein [Schizopora paradoxa]|uniref:p-loop containing nucleoside triphosphate hydrolase protein n=1 Tax=Schizopora paradoxa TaxID=27342 RepID=A0A0H2R9X4_9AGAM|nr:P-loop containing nucleoside triphosphate hydrolase protein [Schizopora paradoxa]